MTGRKNNRRPGSRPIGQPTVMTEALQAKILLHVSAGGTIASYCKKYKRPNPDTVFNFMTLEAGEKFSGEMLRARERGTHAIAEQCITISDNEPDVMRGKLRVDTRLKLIGLWNRKVYGPKLDGELTQRLTLGELVEAAMKHAQQQQPMVDITPQAQLPAPGVSDPLPVEAAPARADMATIQERVRALTTRSRPRRVATGD